MTTKRIEPRRLRALRRSQGLTLVEVMISLVILAGGLLTMATVQMQSMQGGQRGRHLTNATTIAETQLEQLQRLGWGQLAVTGWTAPVVVNNAVQDAGGTQTEQAFNLSWRITDLVVGKTRAIDVRVNWAESDGRARTVALSSVRHNYEAL